MTSEAKDESMYHLPVIEAMADQWPRVDLVNYNSATTPGYHLFMAAVSKLSGGDLRVLRLVNTGIGLALAIIVFLTASKLGSPWGAIVLTTPLLSCQYVLSGSIWLTTDNMALLFVALTLSSAAFATFTARRAVALGVFATCAAAIRQIHVWTAAPIILAAALASPLIRLAPAWVALKSGEATGRESWRNLCLGAAAATIPIVLVATFAILWGGLIPNSPISRELHGRGPNPATFAFALAVFGAMGAFFAPLVMHAIPARTWLDRPTIAGALVGILTAVIVPTSAQLPGPAGPPARGFGSIWRLARLGPEFADRSLVIAALATLGGALLVVFYKAAVRADRRTAAVILLVSLGAWICAQTANSMAWQRYFEPLILLALAWLAAMAPAPKGRWRLAWIGPGLLAAGQLGVSAIAIYRPVFAG